MCSWGTFSHTSGRISFNSHRVMACGLLYHLSCQIVLLNLESVVVTSIILPPHTQLTCAIHYWTLNNEYKRFGQFKILRIPSKSTIEIFRRILQFTAHKTWFGSITDCAVRVAVEIFPDPSYRISCSDMGRFKQPSLPTVPKFTKLTL
jgi:hypothetical protein